LHESSYKGDFAEGGVGQMGKVKRESIEPLGTGFVLWQNQSKFQCILFDLVLSILNTNPISI